MKNVMIVLLIVFSSNLMTAQNRCFDYDSAGNRIERVICWSSSSITSEDTEAIEIIDSRRRNTEGYIDKKQKQFNDISRMIVFPNPTVGYITINMSEISNESKLYIYNRLGNIVFSQDFGDGKFDISFLPSDNYILVVNNNGKLNTSKIIKIRN